MIVGKRPGTHVPGYKLLVATTVLKVLPDLLYAETFPDSTVPMTFFFYLMKTFLLIISSWFWILRK